MTTSSDDQLDDLGERLRQGITRSAREEYSALRRYLDTFRLNLEGELRLLAPDADVASRTKRVETVVAKLLRRPDLPLSHMTDLAGCRIVVPNRTTQQAVVTRLQEAYDVRELDDKSENPRFGYRAVHLDISYQGRLMEIQVQTRNQFRWQQTAERAAGYDVSIKYGGGHPAVAQALQDLSELAWRCDLAGTDFPEADESLADFVILLTQTVPDILTPHSD